MDRAEPRPKPINPIEAAISSWLNEFTDGRPSMPPMPPRGVGPACAPRPTTSPDSLRKCLLHLAPKRWVVYAPMVLLPAGSFGDDWWKAVGTEQAASRNAVKLWTLLLVAIGKREGKGRLTHLAVNSGIPLHASQSQGLGSPGLGMLASGEDCGPIIRPPSQQYQAHGPNVDVGVMSDSYENILRTPSGLIMLHGDFGPSLSPETAPTQQDFEEAFWVSTKQNGIVQVWAPRYTMFSRGNVKEKARLLDFHKSDQVLESRRLAKEKVIGDSAVDLYAGIGYFVFSYVKMGLRRVVGWELNPWSVEGLRRGSIANGWPVNIIRSHERLNIGDARITVVLEDNRNAANRLQGPWRQDLGPIRHVNCGLLPTSQDSWEPALEILDGDGWLHLHENVGVNDVQGRRGEIEDLIMRWLMKTGDQRSARVEHVEYVKTFAPGVWHCVFDVYVSSEKARA